MASKHYFLRARVNTESPDRVRLILQKQFPVGSVIQGGGPKEFLIEGTLEGTSARDLNRALLSALRQEEKRTRLRSEWSCGGTIERFFDYVSKGVKEAPGDPGSGP
ncbi:MAG: hypothetical protein ABSB97_03935 [Thermoplasmata archaeon]|jgi:hypothetical protein